MPNWCENRVDISGEPEDVKKFVELVGEKFDFQKIIPMPKELEDTTSPVRTEGEHANMTPGRQKELLDKYGFDNWYELLNSKGVQTVKKRLKEIFVEQGNTKVGPKIKTAHCTSPDNRLKTLCGRVKKEYCLPLRYFKYAKRPCEKCQRLAEKRKAG